MSWSGTPDPRFGGGNPNRFGLSGSGYAYLPPGEAEAIVGVRIPIWSTKSISGRWTAPYAKPLVASDLVPIGTDRLDGSITNVTGRPLKNAVLLSGRQVYDQLGTIAPGATIRINAATRVRPLTGYLEEQTNSFRGSNPYGNYYYYDDAQASKFSRPDLVRTMMFRGGMDAKTSAEPSIANRYLDLSGQLELGRPMLVAELDGPATTLLLDGVSTSTPPKINQATVIRVILPLGQATGEE